MSPAPYDLEPHDSRTQSEVLNSDPQEKEVYRRVHSKKQIEGVLVVEDAEDVDVDIELNRALSGSIGKKSNKEGLSGKDRDGRVIGWEDPY